MNRARLEIAIVATELAGLMARIRRYSTPQLRALLAESQKRNGGSLNMSYGDMRSVIVDVGESFATYTGQDVPVTPEPKAPEPSAAAMSHARRDFR